MQDEKQKDSQKYLEQARDLLQKLREQAQKVVDERPEARSPDNQLAGATEVYSCTGQVSFAGLIIYEKVQMTCFSERNVVATADMWGIALSIGGTSWGGWTLSFPPTKLPGLGDLDMQVNIVGGTPSLVEVSLWKSGYPVGTYVGSGLGVGLSSVLGGRCKFDLV